jgi:cytochrome c peroxidase
VARRPLSSLIRIGFIAGLLALVNASVTAADVTLNLTFGWQKKSLAVPSAPVVSDAGQTLQFTRVSGLVSEVEFVRADGSSVQLTGQYGFFDAEDPAHHQIPLHSVPEGDYIGLNMRIGVAPETNHSDPSLWSAHHPLNPLTNGLHWGWVGGYVFLAIEGHYADIPDAPLDGGFSFHLATDELPLPVRFTQPFSIPGDSQINLLFDVADLIGSLKLDPAADTTTTHSREGDTLAPRLARAVGPAFWFGNATSTPRDRATQSPSDSQSSTLAAMASPRPFTVPAGWPQPALPHDNAPTSPGVYLGEILFHDPRLSGDATQSCADCHQSNRALSDTVAFSLGIDGLPGTRNAMPLFNQSIAALTNPIEMHGDPQKVVATLDTDADLHLNFAAAFGDDAITIARIGLALEQFLLTEISADSRFDQALRGKAKLTDEEQHGFELFNTEFDPRREQFGADCFHCHGSGLFTDFGFKNNGLDLVSMDSGRALVTKTETDAGKFKTPSLRNVALTAPYMHDGRFNTLEEVITHYTSGVQRAPQLDPNLAKHPGRGVPLKPDDQAALVAFLKTLTDAKFSPE